jgi:hypothetical protein
MRSEMMKLLLGQHVSQSPRRRMNTVKYPRKALSTTSSKASLRQIQLWDHSIPVQHIISTRRRKTLALRIKATGLVVTTPVRCSDTTIDRFVRSKQQWILDHRSKIKDRSTTSFRDGVIVPLLWQELTLRVISHTSKRAVCEIHDTALIYRWSDLSDAKIKVWVDQWYKQQAQTNLIPLTMQLIQEYGFDPSLHIAIKSYKSAYGKCRWAREILLNYRIVMFPLQIVRHIILHELAHTRHMNHSRQFWDCLRQLDPQTDQHRQRLADHGSGYLD